MNGDDLSAVPAHRRADLALFLKQCRGWSPPRPRGPDPRDALILYLVERCRAAEQHLHEDAPLNQTLAAVEARHIARVLADCRQRPTEAAQRLGVSRSTLWHRLRKTGSR